MLSSYEKSIALNLPKTPADKKIADALTAETIKRMLKLPFALTMEDGTEVSATAEEFIVASAIGDAIERGSFDKVQTMMKTTGELSNAVEAKVEVSLVDDDLAKRALD